METSMDVRQLVTEENPVIAYSMRRYAALRMEFGNPEGTKLMPMMWHCYRMLCWNYGKNGYLRKTKRTDLAEFKTQEEAELWMNAVIARYGDEVRWKDENPDKPGDRYGYAGNWTIEQANGK